MKNIVRILIICLFTAAGWGLNPDFDSPYMGPLFGFLVSISIIFLEVFFAKIRIAKIIGGILGGLSGIVLATIITFPFKKITGDSNSFVIAAINALFAYTGLLTGFSKSETLSITGILKHFKGEGAYEQLMLLDSSAVIDGRIADVCDTGFLDGIFVVPQFILQELQHVADSPDAMKRSRGRRGLDVLHRIQKISGITLRIVDDDFPKIKEVDAKLVALARMMDGKIVTNDFNLNKVAQVQNVNVLNINDLANAVKPVVLPGEKMKVFVMKTGKEQNQGVAYMEDGTMVVVENGKTLIGKEADVIVTSVLQTTAGRMIFAREDNV